MKAGSCSLSLFATPGIGSLLTALEARPTALGELRAAVDHPPQTTMRSQLRELAELGVVERRREAEFPRSVGFELTAKGRDLLAVAGVLEHWLGSAPRGPMPFDDACAKRTVKALVDGWDAGIVTALATRPLSLTQLDGEISALSYPSIERRLTAMRDSGLVESCESEGRGVLRRPTSWLRHAAAPLAAAARFERTHLEGSREAEVDVRALLMLALPIVDPPEEATGTAMLVTQRRSPENERPVPEGVTLEVAGGTLLGCAPTVEEGTPSWALGVPDAWLEVIVDGAASRLRFGGEEPKLATHLAVAIHDALREQLGEPAGSDGSGRQVPA